MDVGQLPGRWKLAANTLILIGSAGLPFASAALNPGAYKICMGADPDLDRGPYHSAPPYML